jgi:myo-inositol 2-dehydrogenase/D-chiro-inositol 1-dehydrogenase
MIGIGIIGAGVMGSQHAASAAQHTKDARLVCVAAEAQHQADELAARHGVDACSSVDELLARADVQAVIVATPTDTHTDVALRAIAADKHVLIEKPMARTIEDAERVASAAEDGGRVVAVGHVIRYFPEYRRIGAAIASGELGEVAVATFGRRCQQPDWAPDAWHTSMQRSGGVVLDMMIHDVDLVRWYFGEPTSVYARCLGSDAYGGLDYAIATLTVPGGPICHLHGSWAEPEGFSQMAEVCGSKGMLSYDSRGRDALLVARHGAAGAAATALPPPPADERDPFRMQQADWIGEILGRGTLVNDARWAMTSMRVALAMLESGQTGRVVELAGDPAAERAVRA